MLENEGRVSADPWEALRHRTLDQFVTAVKLSGSVGSVNGFTTPEGWPFVVVVAVAAPGNEAVIPLILKLHRDLIALGAPLLAAKARGE